MYIYLCHPGISTIEPTGRASKWHNSGGSFVHGHTCADHVQPEKWSSILLHGTNTETLTQTHTETNAAYTYTAMYRSALGHKHMLMHTQVLPSPAQPQSYSGPGLGPTRSETASSQQAPASVVIGLACPAPTLSPG